MTYEEIEQAALALCPDERIQLAETLCESVNDSLAIEWAAESIRRLQELESGTAREVPLDEVLRRARAAITG